MKTKILDHYRQFSTYTTPGCYKEYLQSLPDELPELGELVCQQVIHRVTLKNGNTRANADQRYGDMTQFPWHRMRCEDDLLHTAVAMIAELMRLDERGFTPDRLVENKIVVTCRYVSVLMASILKTKGVPTRCRSGFAPYLSPGQTLDHWVNQYWSTAEERWITFDADGFFDRYDRLEYSQFDIPEGEFDWAAQTWLDIRASKRGGDKVVYAGGLTGLEATIRAIFYDFHSLMNNEISYLFQPSYISGKFTKLTEEDLAEIDQLAELMLDPDANFDQLVEIWEKKRKFRLLNSPLVGDGDHL